MSKKEWRALKSCEGMQEIVAKLNDDLKELMNEVEVSSETLTGKATSGERNDRLSELPNDILMSVVSSFTMKETARLSLLSHKWNYIWRCCPVLKFEDKWTLLMWLRSFDIKVLERERTSFVEWVNHVLEPECVDEPEKSGSVKPTQPDISDKSVSFKTAQLEELKTSGVFNGAANPITQSEKAAELAVERGVLGESDNVPARERVLEPVTVPVPDPVPNPAGDLVINALREPSQSKREAGNAAKSKLKESEQPISIKEVGEPSKRRKLSAKKGIISDD